MSFEPKKSALLRMLQIFGEYSDEAHPLKHSDIIRLLNEKYDIDIERKAVGRNMTLLKEAGVNIVSSRKGSYLEGQTFEKNEIRMLIDAVLITHCINAENSENIISKLIEMGGKQFQDHFMHIYAVDFWKKSNHNLVVNNVEKIDDALNKAVKISFEYGNEKKLKQVSPYKMILDAQQYYLMCYDDSAKKISYFNLEQIDNINLLAQPVVLLNSIKGYENGVNFKNLAQEKPYLKSK